MNPPRKCWEPGADYETHLVMMAAPNQTPQIMDAIAAAAHGEGCPSSANRGYGSALQSGFRAATRTLVFYTDGDGQFDLSELPPLLPLMKQYESSAASASTAGRPESEVQRLVLDPPGLLLFRLRIKDINCAFSFSSARYLTI